MKKKKSSWKLDKSIRKFLDASLIGASIVNSEGLIVYVNKSLADLFETTTQIMEGRIVTDYYFDATTRLDIIDELLTKSQVKDRVVKLKRDNNSSFTGSLSFFLSEYAGIDHYFCLFYDLTERLKIEEDLKTQTEHKLRIEHLEKILALGRITADKINNPLMLIQGFYKVINSELLNEKIDIQKIEEITKKIDSAITRIAQSVSDLNNITKN